MEKRVRGRLFRKYVALFVTIVCTALLANGLLEIWFSYREYKASLIHIQHEQAEAAAAKIGQFVREIESQLGWTTQLTWTISAAEQRRFDALRLLRQVPAITEISQVDANGREQLRVSRLAMDVIGSQIDFSHEAKFIEAVAHKVYYGPVYFRRESEPYMTLALAGARRDAGVSIAEVNLKFIWDTVSRIKVGEHGKAYVIDERDRLIADPDISLVLRKTELSHLAHVQAARVNTLGAQGEKTPEAKDFEGRTELIAYAPVAPLGWLLFVELPLDEAYAPIRAVIQRSALLLLAGLCIATLAGLFLARRMVVPIQALRTGAARIGSGDLSQRIAIKTGDELESLADQFNDMAGRLQESYADLENKVKIRTRALAQSVEELRALGEVSQAVNSTLNLETVLSTIVAKAVQLSGTEAGAIYVFEEILQEFRLRATYGMSEEHISAIIQQSIHLKDPDISPAIEHREPIQIADLAERPPSAVNQIILRAGYRSVLIAPLVRSDHTVGLLVVRRREPGEFSKGTIDLIRTFATQSVLAIQNARLFHEIEEQSRQLKILHDQVQAQASDLSAWNRTLEQRVTDQISEIERVTRLKRFLSPQIAEIVMAKGDERLLESHRRDITVVFCDLRGFTAFGETAEPEEVMTILREYHSALGKQIHKFEGTVQHFAGDGVMVIFNDPVPCPDPSVRAVRMAVEMRNDIGELSAQWRKYGHELGFGVGIAQGYATLGRIGFEGRFDYSAIGSVTNLAARLCGEARNGQILVDGKVQVAIESIARTEPMGEVTLKGFHGPVRAFNINSLIEPS